LQIKRAVQEVTSLPELRILESLHWLDAANTVFLSMSRHGKHNMNKHPNTALRLASSVGIGIIASSMMMASTGFAQEESETDAVVTTPDVEVTAYRLPILVSETSQGVSVVTREEIEARNASTVVQLMREIPGLYVDQVGGPGGVANIHIRGSDPEQVMVLIDGVRVNDPMLSRGGSYDLSSLDLVDVERIEVIRGSGSAIYGADAMGGVVNIVTRRSKEPGTTASVGIEGGGQDYGRATGTISGGSERVRFTANASALQDGEDEDGGSLDLKTVSGSLSYSPSDGNGIGLFARHNERESSSFPDFSGGIRLADNRELEQRKAKESVYGGDITLRPQDTLDLKFMLSRYERTEDIDSPGVPPIPSDPFNFVPPSVSRSDFTRDNALVSATAFLPLDSDLVLGYEYMKEDGANKGVLDFGFPLPTDFNLIRKTDSLFAELKSRPVQSLTLQFGYRHDSPSDLEDESSPSAGIRYDFASTGTSLKAHYSEGFRPPSFYALGDPVVGNPDLKSETSKGYEIGLEQVLTDGALRFLVNAFWTDYKNLIDFDTTSFTLVNRQEVEINGAEFELQWLALANLDLGFNYTYVKSEIVNSTDKLRNRPEDKVGFTARYFPTEAWQLAWTTLYIGEFFDSSIPTGDVKMPSYSRTDISAAYTRKHITLTFAVDNLFDERYEQYVGFVDPGVRARAGISARF
jgi:iron complex outermembrane receptor protein/vitamin B12 transporter